MLKKNQNKDKNEQNIVKIGMLKMRSFHGAGSCNIELVTKDGRFYIPK